MLGSVLERVMARLRPKPVATVDALKVFLEERSLLIAQKCAIDYCRGKTGLASYALFTEARFLEALEVCRWEAFAAVLGDLLILLEGQLRPHAGADRRQQLCEALNRVHAEILAATATPAHRTGGWADVIGSFALRLAAASAAEPRRAVDVADHSAKRLFDTLPIHSSYRELDEEVVYGAVRFRVIAMSGEMKQRLAAAELAEALLA
ncbi:MAG: hypothetical protein ACT4P3_07065 [Betaproteobacteria bacterium]